MVLCNLVFLLSKRLPHRGKRLVEMYEFNALKPHRGETQSLAPRWGLKKHAYAISTNLLSPWDIFQAPEINMKLCCLPLKLLYIKIFRDSFLVEDILNMCCGKIWLCNTWQAYQSPVADAVA